MWAALRYRSLNLPKSSASWNQSFSFMSTFVRTNEGLLNLQDVEKVLTDVRADDVKVIPVGKQCDWTDFMVVATGRSTWHVKNIAQALIYKAEINCWEECNLLWHGQAKQKQKEIGARRLMLPSVQGQETGKWVVIDSGKVIVHALDEKARAYYNLENLWTMETSRAEPVQWGTHEGAHTKLQFTINFLFDLGKNPFWVFPSDFQIILVVYQVTEEGRDASSVLVVSELWDLEKAFVKVRPKNNSKKPAQMQRSV
ncbi:hypothetical protein Pint_23665 [Pistacia integerrima]|uniref:Uncharacterized protein n=1 Tax=Pistacia integerrima TaxID=434235 RepID=A0ACC0YJD4_9ROSI|nr:hypothetical protein Pint_23665 [Pistacia integerrima]